MLFNSLPFLYLFLPITYLGFWALTGGRRRHLWLVLTGYLFYATWNYKFCALMAFSTLVSYLAGLAMLRWGDPIRRRLSLVLPVTIDLLVLGLFKYGDFALESFSKLVRLAEPSYRLQTMDLVLPVGISFYTFHTITYIVDSYRGTIRPTRDLAEFACYVSFFPQLVAGPIVRFRQVHEDLEQLGRAERRAHLALGWSFLTIGMIKKVLIADTIAAVIDPAFENVARLSTPDAWLSILGYTYQIYFDFSGYSDMAVGLGLLFGVRLPQNFDSPYKAVDIADFWRRWHISLSSVLRDYLFIPIGGSRGSLAVTCRNLMITMALGGLWHGASWTFVFWGCYHGALLVLHRLTARFWDRLPGALRQGATFLLVVIGWAFFRSESFEMAADLLRGMFTWREGAAIAGRAGLIAMLAIAAVIAHGAPNSFQLSHEWTRPAVLALTVLFVLCLVVITGGRATPFLYFQF